MRQNVLSISISPLFEKLCAADNRPAAGRRNLDKGSAQLGLSRSRESFCVPEAGTASRNRRNIGRISYFFYLLCVQNSSSPSMYFCIFHFLLYRQRFEELLRVNPIGIDEFFPKVIISGKFFINYRCSLTSIFLPLYWSRQTFPA